MTKENQKPTGWLHNECGQWQLNTLLRNRLGRAALSAHLGGKELTVPILSKEANWILGIIGLLLAGVAAILFLGSTWQAVPFALKVILLLGITLACYLLGLRLLYSKGKYAAWGQGLTFAATLFYGFGLWSFNYELGLHFSLSTITFVWAVTIVPLAFFLRCQFILALSSILFALWTACLSIESGTPNLWYLPVFFAILIPLTYREKAWLPLLFTLLGGTTWIVFTTSSVLSDAVFYLPLTLLLWSILLIGVSHIHEGKDTYPGFNRTYFGFGIVIICAALYFLAMHAFGINMAKGWLENPSWIKEDGLLILILNIIFTGVSVDLFRRVLAKKSNAPLLYKVELYGVGLVTLVVWIYTILPESIPQQLAKSILTDHFLFYTLLFNILLYLVTFGIIWIGSARRDGFVQIIAVLTIIVASGTRYFDSPWTVLPRYTFFFVGGIVLLAAAIMLEKKRTRVISETDHEK